jgi:uncharacterized protein YkwD
MRRFSSLLTGIFIVCLSIFLIAGCSPASEDEGLLPEDESKNNEPQISQNVNEESDDNCDEVRSELESVRSKYDELNSDYNELSTKYDELYSEYDELKENYDELKIKYNAAIQASTDIEESDLERVIFDLINEDRRNNGLDELEWTESLYWWAKEHSNYLAERKLVEESDYSYWQAVSRAAGYATADQMAIGVLRIWKESTVYANNFLNDAANFGVVAVSRSGDVFYIVYFAHMEK